ncbi:pyridoxal phosphate-dependent aminotransferase [Sphingomonas sp. M1-B02]|uniref:pyridoxal phosphate-dependent aminotransferase n=1 Tax=Sphingomonas sp. M1-B02 TaxID=3114300 RepID=UPI00223F9DFF|nr:histidinol-phosphate transaminase [Sphingomonas sp. S6-11]UZK66843.1 histidinol-phosphate aminotransferase family protein [Sphingomonas sp. S6-11]
MVMVSRRGVIAAGAATAACAAFPAHARRAETDAAPLFGPAAGVALLSRNENPYGPAPSAIAAINQWASKGCYYADGGAKKLTAMIAERFGVTPDHVTIGSGSTEVLSAAGMAFAGKGAILCPELFWDTTALYAEAKGAKLKRVAMTDGLEVDLDAMAAAMGPDVGMVHICNPNNPTGRLLDGDKLRGFVRAVSPKAPVLIDEAYIELTDRPGYSSVAGLVNEGLDVVVCRTFSKIYGMAGLRVGYAVGRPDTIAKIRDYETSFGGNTAGLAAAIASYDDTAFTTFSKNRIGEARGMLQAAVKSAGLTALPSETNFLFVKVGDADTVQKAMAEKGILIRGAYGKWKNWSRVSTGKIEDVRRYVAALPGVVRA